MKNLFKILTSKNIGTGYLYFYIHFVTEVLCFFVLGNVLGDSIIVWLTPLVYDTFAFVPQSLIGRLSDKYPKLDMGLIGIVLLVFGFISFFLNILPGDYTEVIILCIGNCFLHIGGAEATLRTSKGKLAHSAIFVAGGSFGVVTGKLLAMNDISYIFLAVWALSVIPCCILAHSYERDKKLTKYNYHNKNINPLMIVILSVFVVIARGYMGYGIPTSWNKEIYQMILLYVFMGTGKALGGIMSDMIGIRKTAYLSILGALPFLLFGDKIMVVSLIGVMFFSMTMALTLGLLASVLKNKPGLAFGLTTIGLYLGTVPIFFIKLDTLLQNCIVIVILSIICMIIMKYITRED